jgi:hypothetical protein
MKMNKATATLVFDIDEAKHEALREKAAKHGLTMMGPNTMGYAPGGFEARFVRKDVMGRGITDADCFCPQFIPGSADPTKWLADATDHAIKLIGER